MAFCPNCGSQATGSFCPNCGSALSGAPRPQASGFAPSSSTIGVGAPGITENVAGTLCYIPFLIGIICSIVLLVVAPYSANRTVRFHAFQSLLLHLALFVLSIVFSTFLGLFALATHGLGLVFGGLYPLFALATLVLFIWMMYQTYNQHKVKLPVIGDFADKQA